MNKIVVLALLMLSWGVLAAQDYRPFIAGKVHYYYSTPNYSIRIDSVGMAGGDSVFWLNEIALPGVPNCSPPLYHFRPNYEGYFGDRLVKGADGSFCFVTRAADTAFFQTQVPTGTSWQFTANGNITATLTSRNVSTVGTITDSVLTISLSDGKQYQLSRENGLLSGPVLHHYFSSTPYQDLSIYEVKGPIELNDFITFQVGDWFGSFEQSVAFDRFIRWTVIERTEFVTGDTLRIRFQKQGATQENPSPWYPVGGTATVNYYRSHMDYLNMATYEVHFGPDYYNWVQPWIEQGLGGYFECSTKTHYSGGGFDPNCGYYPPIPQYAEMPWPRRVTQNLGDTYHFFPLGGGGTSTLSSGIYQVECFGFVNGDSIAPCPNAWLLTSTDEGPTPAGRIWSSHGLSGQGFALGWEGLEPGEYGLDVFDLQGRLLHHVSQFMAAEGRVSVEAPLSNGLYLLKLSSIGGLRTFSQRLLVLD